MEDDSYDEIYDEGVIARRAAESETGLPWGDIETPPEWEELLIMCIDTSLSMKAPHHPSLPTWSRTHEVVRHLFDPVATADGRPDDSLYSALEISQGRQRFWTAIVAFSDNANLIMPPTKLVSPDGSTVYRPDFESDSGLQQILFAHQVGSAIGAGLKLAYETARRWIEDAADIPRLVTIAIISDGKAFNDTVPALEYAQQVQAYQQKRANGGRHQIQIATAAYGHDDLKQSDKKFLRDLATHEGLAFIAANGKDLRASLEASVTAGV